MLEIEGRIVIIPFLCGRVDDCGTVTEPDIESILEKWHKRHPEFQGPERNFKIIRARKYLVDEGIATDLVRVTAAVSEDLANYDPSEDADLYDEFLPPDNGPPRPGHETWIEQCEAAERIEAEYDIENALGYLIGEKLLSFLEMAEVKPEWRAELPHFIAKIRETFEQWQIVAYLETPRRLGVLGHTADREGHELLRSQVDDSENLREDARNLMLFEWARQLLTDDQAD